MSLWWLVVIVPAAWFAVLVLLLALLGYARGRTLQSVKRVRIVRRSPAGKCWSVWWGSVDAGWVGWPINPLLWGAVSFRISPHDQTTNTEGRET